MQIVVSNIAVEYDGTPVLTQVDFAASALFILVCVCVAYVGQIEKK